MKLFQYSKRWEMVIYRNISPLLFINREEIKNMKTKSWGKRRVMGGDLHVDSQPSEDGGQGSQNQLSTKILLLLAK